MKIELMAPAKNYASLVEAFEAGADSIFLGLKKYNARCMTENLSIPELMEAIEYAHIRKKKVYLTLNTLIKDAEFEEAVEYARIASEAGIDAIIVQDLGLYTQLIQMKVPLIASTQMTVCNSRGVAVAKKMGFRRIVLARELNIQELQQISQNEPDVELECFIHGGLCIGYSGQCYMSAVYENAAANRGICKTPCWDDYTLYCNETPMGSGKLLKPKDMYGIHHIPRLQANGFAALKIQGRTRSLDYIRHVVGIYRKYIDDPADIGSEGLPFEDLQILRKMSPRGLMRGNLELSVNKRFVVEQDCDQMPRREYPDDYVLGPCEKAKHIAVCLNDLSKLDPALLFPNIERIYIQYDSVLPEYHAMISELRKIAPIYIVMPTLLERYDIGVTDLERMISDYGIDGISLSNIGDLSFLGQLKCLFSTERTMNVCNRYSVEFLRRMGIDSIALPFELSVEEARALADDSAVCFERLVYGRPPLVRMKYCLIAKTNECVRCGKCRSGDRYTLFGKNDFLVQMNPNRNETTLFPMKKIALPVYENERNLLRFEFTDESTSQMNEILSAYYKGHFPQGDYIDNIGSV